MKKTAQVYKSILSDSTKRIVLCERRMQCRAEYSEFLEK